jgi:4-hydroxybenzoate polyprenyltransferase
MGEITLESRVVGFALATHLGPTLAVAVMAGALSLQAGLGIASLTVFAVALTGQCSVGWSNDAVDAEIDRQADRREKPTVQGRVSRTQLGYAALVAAAISLSLSWLLPWQAALLYTVALGSAWAYNLVLKSTLASAVPYGISFGLLPATVTMAASPAHWPPIAVMLGAGLLGVGAHFINTLKDVSQDRVTGVRGLPQRMGPSVSLWVGAACTALVLGLVFSVSHQSLWAVVILTAGVLALAAVVIGALVKASEWAWRFIVVEALLCVAMVLVSGSALRH